jgi:dTDP-4-amino-4,6-dideoxygalactose transaminase
VKHITTGEGGGVSTNAAALRDRLARFRTHGITRHPAELTRDEGPWWYEQHDLGFNYRITDFQCVLGRQQLARLPEFVAERRRIAAAYDADFADDTGIRPVPRVPWSTGSYHLYVVHVEPAIRRRVFEALRADGIGVNVHYIPVPEQPYYAALGYTMDAFPGARAYYAGAISLPVFVGLREDERQRVVESIRRHVRG